MTTTDKVFAAVFVSLFLAACAQKTCPKPFDSFKIYDRPGPIVVEGTYTIDSLKKALREVTVKSRVQSAIIDSYEADIRRYNKTWKDLK